MKREDKIVGNAFGHDQSATVDERIPFRVRPMLATLVPQPFHRNGWVYEEKYDGDRILAYKEGRQVRLVSRNDKDRTESFREIATTIRELRARTLLLDGEVIAVDSQGISRIQLLQRGTMKRNYAVFDCLYKDGIDMRREALSVRRNVLESTLEDSDVVLLSRRLADDGLLAYRIAKKRGYEGVVAKEESAPYIEGRSRKWLKIKVRREEEFVIAGYTAPSGSRKHFGSLLLGAYRNGQLYYVGKVGTGFSEQTLASLSRMFKPLIRSTSPFSEPLSEKDATYLAPLLVARVAFQEWTADRRLRQPTFLGLRDDKSAEECLLLPNDAA